MGGGGSASKSRAESENSSFIDPTQNAFLKNLFQQGEQISNSQQQQGSQFQDSVLNPSVDAFQNFLTPQQNPFLMGQIEQGQQQITENLQQNILPSVGQSAAGAGQRGGGRQGVAEGIALRDANRQSSNFSQNLITRDFQGQQNRGLQALGLAPQIGGLQFAPLQNFRNILGNSTVVGRGSSESKSDSGSASVGAG